MVSVVREEFVPDPSASRDEMEAVQRTISEVAVFETDTAVDVEEVSDRIVVGVDQAFYEELAISAVVACRGGSVIEEAYAVSPLSFPYVPGFLSFREGGPIIQAIETLEVTPDVVLFDGNGRIHYRQVGLATHMGVVFELPSVGVAKRLLCGAPESDISSLEEGEFVAIRPDESVSGPETDILGYAVQTRQYDTGSHGINPVYVSAGHRIGSETAVKVVLELCSEYKLPEPIRRADRLAGEVKADLTE